ncbi:MAG: tRNA (N6-threonylcarbamoyladenosine(37)-N6)-methyltransferase TrmO [Desulfovibrionaceae bacterium]
MTFQLTPVGVVHSELTQPTLRAGEDGLSLEATLEAARDHNRRVRELVSEIEIFEPYVPMLEGIRGFSHIIVLYWPHLLPEERRSTEKVHPMGREEFPLTGVFATNSPARPNPVLVSTVRLLGRDGGRLHVRGLEAVEGSPVLDIKPYNPHYMAATGLVLPGWMARIQSDADSGD